MLGQLVLAQARRLMALMSPGAEGKPTASDPSAPPIQPLAVSTPLRLHSALLRRIKTAYGYPDSQFERHLHAPISALAAWIHGLPGPPGGGFDHPGGAIEQALNNCLFSLQAADGRIFLDADFESPSADTTQHWRLACALGGLFVALPRMLATIEVVSEGGDRWPAAAMPLVQWLESRQARKYHHRWTSHRTDGHWPSIYVASRCIEPDIMSFLTQGDARIPAAMMRSIAGRDGSTHDTISEVVHQVALAVTARTRPQGATPPAGLLTHTLKRLLGTSDWLPNAPGGHVWLSADSLYLLWPIAGIKLRESIPSTWRDASDWATNDRLLQHLVACGALCAVPSPLAQIRLPGQSKPHDAVRVADHQRTLVELGIRATPIEIQLSASDIKESASGSEVDGPGRQRHEGTNSDMPSRCGPNFELFPVPDAEARSDSIGTSPQAVAPSSRPTLSLDTSKIANPRTRELIDDVVKRLEHQFDSMIAKIMPGGVFVALTEFVGLHGDGAQIVRCLHDAGLLAVHKDSPHRRAWTETIDGIDVSGVVLPHEAIDGYPEWAARWRSHGIEPSVRR